MPKDAQMVIPELETLEFVKEGRNVVLYGNPGTGKTHIATALGIKACMEGYTVFFTSVPHLLTQIRECRSQKSLRQLELRFEKYDMVICDDAVITHELTVKFADDGSFQYLGNEILDDGIMHIPDYQYRIKE